MAKSPSPPKKEERATTPVLGGRVRHALERVVDFGEPRRLQADAARSFKDRRFHDAFRAAKDAVSRIEGESRDYVESGMALAIASARRILETSEGTTAWAKKVSDNLGEVMEAFEGGSFAEATPLLETLEASVTRLYNFEMDRHRNHVAAQGRAIAEIEAMGGEATLPRRKLRRAILALAQEDRESYLEIIDEVDELVETARTKRVEAIQGSAEEVGGPLREGLATALESGDFISAHFLLLASQETARQEAPTPTPTPTTNAFRDRRRVDLLNEVLSQIGLVIERAEAHGLDVTPAAEDLASARRLAASEDYAQALVRGRRAYHLLKTLKSQAEAGEEELDALSSPGAEEFQGSLAEEEEDLEFVEGDTLLWCLECGSVQVGLDPEGHLRCLRCDAVVPMTFP